MARALNCAPLQPLQATMRNRHSGASASWSCRCRDEAKFSGGGGGEQKPAQNSNVIRIKIDFRVGRPSLLAEAAAAAAAAGSQCVCVCIVNRTSGALRLVEFAPAEQQSSGRPTARLDRKEIIALAPYGAAAASSSFISLRSLIRLRNRSECDRRGIQSH